MFYMWDFMHREISVTSIMFYFMVPRYFRTWVRIGLKLNLVHCLCQSLIWDILGVPAYVDIILTESEVRRPLTGTFKSDILPFCS